MTAITTAEKTAIVTMGFGSMESFEFMQRTAKMFASSSMVPSAYRMVSMEYDHELKRKVLTENPSAIPNCVIALNMSQRMNADPLMIMQNLHIIEGRPSWSSQFIIASINSCGKFAPLRFHKEAGVEIEAACTTFEWENNKKRAVVTKTKVINDRCIAWTVERGTTIPTFSLEEIKSYGSIYQCCKAYGVPLLESTQVSLAMAVAEGWYGKNGSKWQTMPDLMLQYRSAAFFGRIYAPELLMGLPADDEVRDTIVLTQDPDGGYSATETAVAPTGVRQPQSKSAMAAAAAEGAPLQPAATAEIVEPKSEVEKSPTGPVDPATGEVSQPAATTPAASKPVTQHTDASIASPGQRKNILGRVAGNALDLRETLEKAGLSSLPDDLEGLTVDGFQAIKDILPKV